MNIYPYRAVKLILILLLQVTMSIAYAETLAIGSISNRPANEIKRFQPLVDYLSESLIQHGIDNIKLIIAGSTDEMIGLMQSGQVSVYLDSPFPSLTLAETGASRIVLRRWKKGVEQYHSVIFVHKDNAIDTLEDLKGKMIGFEEEFSTSSYYIPKASMQKNGLLLSQKSDRHADVPANEVGYLFTDDDRNTVTWVRKKRIAAGAINNIKFSQLKEKFKGELKIIFRSVSVPRQVVNFSNQLSPTWARVIKEALLNMDKTEKGRAQLKAFEKTRKFDEFPMTIDEAMTPLKILAASFK